jgi:hypothetical protein
MTGGSAVVTEISRTLWQDSFSVYFVALLQIEKIVF